MNVLNILLLTSDPLITSMRQLPAKKSNKFSKETLEMLLPECSSSSAMKRDEHYSRRKSEKGEETKTETFDSEDEDL